MLEYELHRSSVIFAVRYIRESFKGLRIFDGRPGIPLWPGPDEGAVLHRAT